MTRAGVAATLAVNGAIDVSDIDVRALQTQLVKQGASRPTQKNQPDEAPSLDAELEESIHWQAVNEARAFD